MIALEPSRLVSGYAERVRVRLREHVVPVHLAEYLPCGLLRHLVLQRTLQKALPVRRDQMLVVRSAEGAAHLVRLRRSHAAHIHQQLHHLLLPHDDAASAFQRALLQLVIIVPLDTMPVAVYELRDRAALHAHAGPYERHLVRQIAQVPRSQALGYL